MYISAIPSTLDFGTVPNNGSGTSLTITVSTTSVVQINSLVIDGLNSTDFTCSNSTPITVSPATPVILNILFKTTVAGANKAATLHIYNTDPSAGPGPSTNHILISLTGTSTPPDISIVDNLSELDFEDISINTESDELNITIQNGVGAETLSITSVTIDGVNTEEFEITTLPAETVLAGETTIVGVTFKPTVIETNKTAILHIYSNDLDVGPGPNTGHIEISLLGEGLPPAKARAATGMKDKLAGQTAASSAMGKLAEALQDFIMNNAVVRFTWNGIKPGSPPTPETKPAKGKIQNLVFNLTPYMQASQSGAFQHFHNQLVAGLSTATYNITDSGYSTGPLPMSSSPTISTALVLSVNSNTQDGALGQLSSCIVDWVEAQLPPVPVTGSRGSYLAPPGSGGLIVSIKFK